MRTVADMIAAPGCKSAGKLLLDLKSHECRFPLHGSGAGMRFCAVEISAGDWKPGCSGGSYCTFHRNIVRGRGSEGERTADRVLERLG